jgi:hypothetical protein
MMTVLWQLPIFHVTDTLYVDRDVNFVIAAAVQDVKHCTTSATLFRGNTLATKVVVGQTTPAVLWSC